MESLLPMDPAINKLANANSDVSNWIWDEQDRWREVPFANFSTDLVNRTLSIPPLDGPRSSIFIRDSYREIFDRIWRCAFLLPCILRGAVVTGTPGTGKTKLLFYLLSRLLEAKQPVLFSTNGSRLYFFWNGHTFFTTATASSTLPTPSLDSSGVFLWSLFDIQDRTEPPWPFLSGSCFPIQTASPDPICYKQWSTTENPLVIGLPLWTREELEEGLRNQAYYGVLVDLLRKVYPESGPSQMNHLTPNCGFAGVKAVLEAAMEGEAILEGEEEVKMTVEGALSALLSEAIYRFGYAARDIFRAIPNFADMTQKQKEALRGTYQVMRQSLAALASGGGLFPSVSHQIFAVRPVRTNNFESDGWDLVLKSTLVAQEFQQQISKVEDIDIAQTIEYFRTIPEAGGLAGHYFEPFAHGKLARGGYQTLVEMTSNGAHAPVFTLNLNTHCADVYFGKGPRRIVKFETLPELLDEHSYYKPFKSNFALLDAFAIDFDKLTNSAIVWILQMTTSQLHRGSRKGYQFIRKIIAMVKEQLRASPPLPKVPKKTNQSTASVPEVEVRYILVTPTASTSDPLPTKWQFPVGWTQNCVKHNHRGKVYSSRIIVGVADT